MIPINDYVVLRNLLFLSFTINGQRSYCVRRKTWVRAAMEVQGWILQRMICVLEETFLQWRQLKSEKNLPDDDSVARYLLKSAHDRAIFDASKFDQLYLSFVAI